MSSDDGIQPESLPTGEGKRKRNHIVDDDSTGGEDEPTLMTMDEIKRYHKREWYRQNVSPNGPNGRKSRKHAKEDTPGKVELRRLKRQQDREDKLAREQREHEEQHEKRELEKVRLVVGAQLQHSMMLMDQFNQNQQALNQQNQQASVGVVQMLGQHQNSMGLPVWSSSPYHHHNVPFHSNGLPVWALPHHLNQDVAGQMVLTHQQYQHGYHPQLSSTSQAPFFQQHSNGVPLSSNYDYSDPLEPRPLESMIAFPLWVVESHFGAPGDHSWYWLHDDINEHRPGIVDGDLPLPFTDDDIPSVDGDLPSMDYDHHRSSPVYSTSTSSLALPTPQRGNGNASSPRTPHRSSTVDSMCPSSPALQSSRGPPDSSTGATLALTCVPPAPTPTTSSFPSSGPTLSVIAQSPAGKAGLRYVDTMEGGRTATNLMAMATFMDADQNAAIAPVHEQNYHARTVVMAGGAAAEHVRHNETMALNEDHHHDRLEQQDEHHQETIELQLLNDKKSDVKDLARCMMDRTYNVSLVCSSLLAIAKCRDILSRPCQFFESFCSDDDFPTTEASSGRGWSFSGWYGYGTYEPRGTWSWLLSFVLEESSVRCATGFTVVLGCLVVFSCVPVAGPRFKIVSTFIAGYALQEGLIATICEVGPWLFVVAGMPFISTVIMDSQIHHQVVTATSSDELQQHGSTWQKWNWALWVIQVVVTAIFFINSTNSK